MKVLIALIMMLLIVIHQPAAEAAEVLYAHSAHANSTIQSELTVQVDADEAAIRHLLERPEQLFALLPHTTLNALEETQDGYRVYLAIKNCIVIFCDTSTQTYAVRYLPDENKLKGELEVADSFTEGAFEISLKKTAQGKTVHIVSTLEADFIFSRFMTNAVLTYKTRQYATQFQRNLEGYF